jgi:dolichyl-phosphate beta-glucosyltransferase
MEFLGFDIFSLIVGLFASAVLGLALVSVMLLLARKPFPQVVRYAEEKYFEDPSTRLKCPFPSLTDMPSVSLSVIVPAYNEELRLTPMLEDCLEYLERRTRVEPKFVYEIIVVNDGSKDRTADVAMRYAEKYGGEKIRLLNLVKNRGKGGAVRLGVQSSRGEFILFADADGATRFSDLDKLYSAFQLKYRKAQEKGSEWKFPCIICGSRAHLEQDSIAHRSLFRTVLMYGFHFLVWLFTVRSIRDTQCGFKLFTRSAARICFPNLHIERWAFDAELLYIAETLNIDMDEVAVYWTEIEGSKVTPVLSWIQMGWDLFFIWLRYKIGAWQFVTKGE